MDLAVGLIRRLTSSIVLGRGCIIVGAIRRGLELCSPPKIFKMSKSMAKMYFKHKIFLIKSLSPKFLALAAPKGII